MVIQSACGFRNTYSGTNFVLFNKGNNFVVGVRNQLFKSILSSLWSRYMFPKRGNCGSCLCNYRLVKSDMSSCKSVWYCSSFISLTSDWMCSFHLMNSANVINQCHCVILSILSCNFALMYIRLSVGRPIFLNIQNAPWFATGGVNRIGTVPQPATWISCKDIFYTFDSFLFSFLSHWSHKAKAK